MATTNVSLKLLVDKKSNRVLFAEASNEFVDFLFYILSLPAGTIVSLLTKEGMVGSLGNLYGSIENLSTNYMLPDYQNKDCILNPTIPNTSSGINVNLLLLPDVDQSTTPTRKNFYRCSNTGYSGTNNCREYVSDDPSSKCPLCKNPMSTSATYVASVSNTINSAASSSFGEKLGFVKGVVTYTVMDDLIVKPLSTISSLTLLTTFNIKDIGDLEEKEINFGMDEAVKLIKASLESKTILTDVFLGKKSPTHG